DVAEYYAMCEWFDETCGQLLNHLDDSGLTENTLVIYICDNGWRAASMNANDPHQELWQRYALRSKGSPYENGIRTPIMISWPAKLQPRRVNNLAHAIDVLPTIAAASGFESPDGLAGINLMDEKARSKRNAVFGVCNAIQDISLDDPDETLQYLWCISDGWKLLLRHAGKDTTMYRKLHVWDDKPLRLYNISLDPNEANDVSEEHPEIAKRLRRKIEAWHSVQKKGQDDARNLR
ncbi:MAG: sulfatase-like hydrolase/transferase, partial [Planctomycetota bacterium]